MTRCPRQLCQDLRRVQVGKRSQAKVLRQASICNIPETREQNRRRGRRDEKHNRGSSWHRFPSVPKWVGVGCEQ